VVLDTITLQDGSRVVLRHIEADDKVRLAASHSRLSEDTVRRRFLAAKPSLTQSDLRYLTEVDHHDHLAVVAVDADDPERIVAVARWIRLPKRPLVAEWAIVVADDQQGLGLGGHMARLLADEAVRLGIRSFTATVYGENQPIQHLMRSITQDLHADWAPGGVRELAGELRAAA